MKHLRKGMSLALLLFYLILLALPVAASTVSEYEGVQVMVKMNQDYYTDGEQITATITVINTNPNSVTIANVEQLIPEGYVLSEGSNVSTQDVELKSGQSMELQVTFEGESAEEGESTFWDELFYGSTLGVPNIFLIVILIIGIIAFFALT